MRGEVPADAPDALFRWVAILTGSKNALKGVGFFLGGLLLTLVGFRASLLILGAFVLIALLVIVACMRDQLGRADGKARFSQMFSNSRAVNLLSAARLFLFASRDVWFVVGPPVFLQTRLGWSFWQTGTFLAVWVIGYGGVQASAPRLLGRASQPDGRSAVWLAVALAIAPAAIAAALSADISPTLVVVVGLAAFGVIFALNSAVHSFLILSYAETGKAAMNVGFYYMANAGGRLAGTISSGALYEWRGLTACLWASVAFVVATAFLSLFLPGAPASTLVQARDIAV